tara:strand:- start:232 stop:624 length:393 start_codon:yes stop_codon:yes gene_type:complete
MRYIITLTILGIIPFYLNFFLILFGFSNAYNFNFQLVYGAMIVSFISGMQWQRLIYFKNKLIWLIIPILNFLFTWIFVFYNTFQKYFVINGLVICLLLDLIVRDKILNVNYIRTRIVATILAILSFFVNY